MSCGCHKNKEPVKAQAAFQPISGAVPGSVIDPATGMDLGNAQILEGALVIEFEARAEGTPIAEAQERAIASLGCSEEILAQCVDIYLGYADARIRFRRYEEALGHFAATGDVTVQEMGMALGSAPTQTAQELYLAWRGIVGDVLDTIDVEGETRALRLENFGGPGKLLRALLEILMAEGLEMPLDIYPPPMAMGTDLADPNPTGTGTGTGTAPVPENPEQDTNQGLPTLVQPPPAVSNTVRNTLAALISKGIIGIQPPPGESAMPDVLEDSPNPTGADEPDEMDEEQRPAPVDDVDTNEVVLPPAGGAKTKILHTMGLFVRKRVKARPGIMATTMVTRYLYDPRAVKSLRVDARQWWALEIAFERLQASANGLVGAADPSMRYGAAFGPNDYLEAAIEVNTVTKGKAESGFVSSSSISSKSMRAYTVARARYNRFISALVGEWSRGELPRNKPTRTTIEAATVGSGICSPSKIDGKAYFRSNRCQYIPGSEKRLYERLRTMLRGSLRNITTGEDAVRDFIRAWSLADMEARFRRLYTGDINAHMFDMAPPPAGSLQNAMGTLDAQMRPGFGPMFSVRKKDIMPLPKKRSDIFDDTITLGRRFQTIGALGPAFDMKAMSTDDLKLALGLSQLRQMAEEMGKACLRGELSACTRAKDVAVEIGNAVAHAQKYADDFEAVMAASLNGDLDEGLSLVQRAKMMLNDLIDGDDDFDFDAVLGGLELDKIDGDLGMRTTLVILALVALGGFVAYMATGAYVLYHIAPSAASVTKDAIAGAPDIINAALPIKSAIAGVFGGESK